LRDILGFWKQMAVTADQRAQQVNESEGVIEDNWDKKWDRTLTLIAKRVKEKEERRNIYWEKRRERGVTEFQKLISIAVEETRKNKCTKNMEMVSRGIECIQDFYLQFHSLPLYKEGILVVVMDKAGSIVETTHHILPQLPQIAPPHINKASTHSSPKIPSLNDFTDLKSSIYPSQKSPDQQDTISDNQPLRAEVFPVVCV